MFHWTNTSPYKHKTLVQWYNGTRNISNLRGNELIPLHFKISSKYSNKQLWISMNFDSSVNIFSRRSKSFFLSTRYGHWGFFCFIYYEISRFNAPRHNLATLSNSKEDVKLLNKTGSWSWYSEGLYTLVAEPLCYTNSLNCAQNSWYERHTKNLYYLLLHVEFMWKSLSRDILFPLQQDAQTQSGLNSCVLSQRQLEVIHTKRTVTATCHLVCASPLFVLWLSKLIEEKKNENHHN